MKHATFPNTGQRSAEECLFWMPRIASMATNAWAKDFASSVVKQSRRRGWQPSGKQLGVMRRLVAELFQHEADDFTVIE